MELNPNCSEATIRLNVNSLSSKEIDELMEVLECLYMSLNYEPGEADIRRLNIFGIDVIEIHGDFPYNHSDEIELMRDKAEKKFRKVIYYDYQEP